ncbi:MAG: hypothetical protein ACR2JO_08600 [Mycobacteriales bacterium]
MTRISTRLPLAIAATAALALGAAGCGGSSNDKPAAQTQSRNPADNTPQVTLASLSGMDTAVAVDKGALAALTALGVAPSPTGTGKLTMTYGPTLDFPITGGSVKVYDKAKVSPYVTGSVEHNGSGLMFSKGATKLVVSDFVVDPGASMLTATVAGAPGFPLFLLDGSNLAISKDSAGNAKLDGTMVELTPEAAAALNKTFKVTAFQPRMLIGIAHITAH